MILTNGGYAVQLIEPVGPGVISLNTACGFAKRGNALEGLDVKFHFGVSVQAVYKDSEGVRAVLSDGSEIKVISYCQRLVCASISLAENKVGGLISVSLIKPSTSQADIIYALLVCRSRRFSVALCLAINGRCACIS